MLIREFAPEDAVAVSNVIRQTMRVTNSKDYSMENLSPLIEYFSPKKVLSLNEERICLVAEIDGQIVGTIALEDSVLQTFFVAPNFQGKGIGTSLIKAIEAVALKNKIKTVKFASSITAGSFYEKMGYRKNGFEREATAGKQIEMEKDLTQ